jgi:hypothetical protein
MREENFNLRDCRRLSLVSPIFSHADALCQSAWARCYGLFGSGDATSIAQDNKKGAEGEAQLADGGGAAARDEAIAQGGAFNKQNFGTDASSGQAIVQEDSIALGGYGNNNTLKGDEYRAEEGATITINNRDDATAQTFADTVKEIVAARSEQVADEVELGATEDDGEDKERGSKLLAVGVVVAVVIFAAVVAMWRKARKKS